MWKIRIYTFLTVLAFGVLYLFTGIVVIILNSAGLFKAEEGSTSGNAILGKISISDYWQEAAYRG